MAMGVERRGGRASFELPFEDLEMLSLRGYPATRQQQPRASNNPLPPSLPNGASAGAGRSGEQSTSEEYAKWVERHPHAVRCFDQLLARMQGKRVAVFLDYDGTLTPIVRNPDAAFISNEMRETVRDLAGVFPTAIVSGRGREKVESFMQLEGLCYAGSHGLDISAPKEAHGNVSFSGVECCQPAADFAPVINEAYKTLCKEMEQFPGALVEHNKFCLSVHFRNCDSSALEDIEQVVECVVEEHKDLLKVTRGRKVLEVRPQVAWDKGRAVEHLLKALNLDDEDVLPIYVGDDRTDEDAFKALKARGGGPGIGVLVSSKVKATDAQFTLQDPVDVDVFLSKLVAWGRGSGNKWMKGR